MLVAFYLNLATSFMKTLKNLTLGSIALSSVFLANIAPANAIPSTSTLPGVNIGGTIYNITFQQFVGGGSNNSFNAFYGTNTPPAIPFDFTTEADARDAVTAILAQLALTTVDVTPASDGIGNGFRVAFGATATNYQYVSGNNGSGPFPTALPFFDASRTSTNNFSMVSASPATPVPLESDGWAVLGATAFLGGGMWYKRRRAQAKANLNFVDAPEPAGSVLGKSA